MKLKLKNTPDQIELVRAMGSNDNNVSMDAQTAFAAFIGPVVQQVLMQAGSANMLFTDMPYDEDDHPSIPLDLWYTEGAGFVTIWSQSQAGGLPSSHIEGLSELKVSTYRLDSAINILKKYARRARLDVVSRAIERMANEVLIKRELNEWAVALQALGTALTSGLRHVIPSGAQNFFLVDDLSNLITRSKLINRSYANGTPADYNGKGITDLFVSPEIKGQVRGFAYNPMNPVSTLSAPTTSAIPLPNETRQRIFDAAGATEIFGITLHELMELGVARKYNTLFGVNVAAGVSFAGVNFSGGTDEILVGVDLSRECCIRPIARNADSGATFTAVPDDQWVSRSEKIGWYGREESGAVVVDSRALVGLIV